MTTYPKAKATNPKPNRRKYENGYHCKDCGHETRTTVAYFWLTGPSFPYRLCGSCIKAYRGRLLK